MPPFTGPASRVTVPPRFFTSSQALYASGTAIERSLNLGAVDETIVRALYPLQLRVEGPVHALPVSDAAFELAEYALYREAKQDGIFL